MNKIYWILAFLGLTFLGDRIGGMILKQITDKSQFRYSRLYTGAAESDILLVGNSRGLMFYQPYIEDITGKSTFNISYNGMPMNLGKVLVEDYLEKYPAPELMILDITMCDRLNNGLISGFNLYTPYSDRLSQLMQDSLATASAAGKLSHLYRYNSEIFQRTLFYLNKSDEDWLLDRVITDDLVQSIEDRAPYNIEVPPSILADCKATVEAAKAKGVEVQLVINPYFPPFAAKIENLAEFKSVFEDALGLPVHDYSSAVTNLEGFGDYQHLNKLGSKEFLDLLSQDNILKPKGAVGELISQ